jgi:hypothetical protein
MRSAIAMTVSIGFTAGLPGKIPVSATQEKVVQANAATAQQAPTEENLQRLESAVGQLRQFKREARGVFRIE